MPPWMSRLLAGKTPTGGRRCPPEARATLHYFRWLSVFRQIQSSKMGDPKSLYLGVPATLCGQSVSSNAGLLGCFFPEGSQVPNLVFLMSLSLSPGKLNWHPCLYFAHR